ncbi:MAG: hypothetical protein SH856_03830 [Flavobacteriales bacterium]|nr:hypothetical protein [Flavobacteriales bacterium]
MKNSRLLPLFALFMLSILLTSCEAIAGIFKAGMGVGIFLVIAVIVVVVVLVMRTRKK